MTRLTTKQIRDLDRMNQASKLAGGLGTVLDAMQYGSSVTTPTAGSLTPMRVVHYQVAPAAVSATYVHAAISLTTAAQDITTAITNPDVPRNVTVKGNQATITTDVVITGTNMDDEAITETITLNSATEVAGSKAFKTVTNIHVPIKTNTGDTVSVGVGSKIGLPYKLYNALEVMYKYFDGSTDAGGVTASASVLESNVHALAGSANGSKKCDYYILVP